MEKLSVDLASGYDSSKGYSAQNFWYMRQFYYEYKGNRKLQQLVGEIPWGYNIMILSKVKKIDEREYYIKASSKLDRSLLMGDHKFLYKL
ncbi:MAG: DUF1016 N-terminal domain-containing protein [Candidatus Scalindua sp.]|nr:DUF1016 N-terminal domain-containing protein [Candidatus Scalindua sp.]